MNKQEGIIIKYNCDCSWYLFLFDSIWIFRVLILGKQTRVYFGNEVVIEFPIHPHALLTSVE